MTSKDSYLVRKMMRNGFCPLPLQLLLIVVAVFVTATATDSCEDTSSWFVCNWTRIFGCGHKYAHSKCRKTCNLCENGEVTTTSPQASTPKPAQSFPPTCIRPRLTAMREARFLDMTVTGTVVLTKEVHSELECEDICLREYTCVAYNYHYKAAERKKCQIFERIEGNAKTPGFSCTLFDRVSVEKLLLAKDSDCF